MCGRLILLLLTPYLLQTPLNAQEFADAPEGRLLLGEDTKERERLEAIRTELEEELALSHREDHVQGQEGEGAIPGQPGVDYPVYKQVPQTSFACASKLVPGYYADLESRCQVFHICGDRGSKHSFLCPVGSVFNQKYLVCDWWFKSSCDDGLHDVFPGEIDLGRLHHQQNIRPDQEADQRQYVHETDQYVPLGNGVDSNNFLQEDILYSEETGVPNREIKNTLLPTGLDDNRRQQPLKGNVKHEPLIFNNSYQTYTPTNSTNEEFEAENTNVY